MAAIRQRKVISDWDTCASMLGRALSRYNGLTNSAKLELITAVVTGDLNSIDEDLFEKKPFCYAYEVIKKFELEGKIGARSAEVLLHHSIAFGFLYRAVSGGTSRHAKLATRVESTSHIALTPLGRALRSAKILGQSSDEFKKFLWEYAILECDFDLYALLIKTAEENDGKLLEIAEFYNSYYDIRDAKYQWLIEKFPYTVQYDKIIRRIQWIPRRDHKWHWGDSLPEFNGQTPNHHYDQRKRWAKKLFDHIDESKMELTDRGRQFASYLPPTTTKPFFWLGPPIDCLQSRFLSSMQIPQEYCTPAWNFWRPTDNEEETSISNDFVDGIASYMEKSFDLMRFRDFIQTPLEAVIPYAHFLGRELNEQVNIEELFSAVLEKHKSKLVFTLRKNLSQIYYRLRKRN